MRSAMLAGVGEFGPGDAGAVGRDGDGASPSAKWAACATTVLSMPPLNATATRCRTAAIRSIDRRIYKRYPQGQPPASSRRRVGKPTCYRSREHADGSDRSLRRAA